MPLIQSKSKKAMSKNIETEMHEGKPQKQAIAIAYNVKRKAPKKMAEGGMAYKNDSAKTESRPMPNERNNDRIEVEHNSAIKPSKNDSWTDRSTEAQAQKPSPTGLKRPQPLKMAKMASSGAFSVRTRGMDDEESDMESSIAPSSPKDQPSSSRDEEDATKMGKSPDMSKPHTTPKAYFEGGVVSQKASEEDEEPGMSPIKESYMSPSEDEFMSKSKMAPMLAEGGSIHREMMMQPMDEIEEEMHNSLADAIMAKRARESASMSGDPDYPVKMARGGEILSEDSMETTDDDQADLARNTQEDANMEDKASFDALRKENYSSDYMDADDPMDSNETGDEREKSQSDPHDMVDSIRRKMASRRQMR